MPEFTRQQLEELSDLIYGYFIEKMLLEPEIAANITVDFKYEPQSKSDKGSEASSCEEEAIVFPIVLASANCVLGSGFGCSAMPGYRLG
jgi:hypothetical protein